MTNKRLVWLLAASAAAHAAVPLAIDAGRHIYRQYEQYAERVEHETRRERLVLEAKARLRRGEFRLGEFLLKANAIDAEDQGREIDIERARAEHDNNVYQIGDRIGSGMPVQQAVSEVLGHLNYHGAGEGGAADALIEGGGNCERLSLVAAAAVYDAGYGENIYLRVYDGHIAPVYVENGIEYDLLTGGRAYAKGVIFRAEELIDMYGKGGTGNGDDAQGFRYPSTTDKYPGHVPLFASTGFGVFEPDRPPPAQAAETTEAAGTTESTRDAVCQPQRRLLNMFPQFDNPDPSRVFTFRTISGRSEPVEDVNGDLDHLVKCIESDEGILEVLRTSRDTTEKVLYLAHLAGVYQETYWNFVSLGKYALARETKKRQDKVIEEAEGILSDIASGVDEEQRFFEGLLQSQLSASVAEPWQLLFLGKNGERMLLDFVDSKFAIADTKIQSFVALLTNPGTHDEAVRRIDRLGRAFQMRVASMQLWGVNSWRGALESIDEDNSEYYRASQAYLRAYDRSFVEEEVAEPGYPVFSELQHIVREELERNGLGSGWEAPLMVACGRESFSFTPMTAELLRENAGAFLKSARDFRAWLDGVDSSDPEAARFKTMLDYICEKGEMSMKVLEAAERHAYGISMSVIVE